MSAQGFTLENKKILVTGGSRGIGAGIVQSLAQAGAQVAFTYSSREDAAVKVLKDLPGTGHKTLQMDISSETSIQDASQKLLEEWGELDGLVNNAGITKDQLLLRMKSEDFDQVIQTNLRGSFLVTKAFLKSFVKSRKGSIVFITSVIGQTGNAGQANYAASKAGTEAFSKSLALEIASRGIRSNCVAPGFIATEMTDVLSDEQRAKILSQIPLASIGQTEDVAYAVRYLLSDAAKYMTGQTININGGLFMS